MHEWERSEKNLLGHELIGLNAKASRHGHDAKGRVSWETKNCIEIETGKKTVMLPKKETVFEFSLGKKKVRVDGRLLASRPEERTKAFAKKYMRKRVSS